MNELRLTLLVSVPAAVLTGSKAVPTLFPVESRSTSTPETSEPLVAVMLLVVVICTLEDSEVPTLPLIATSATEPVPVTVMLLPLMVPPKVTAVPLLLTPLRLTDAPVIVALLSTDKAAAEFTVTEELALPRLLCTSMALAVVERFMVAPVTGLVTVSPVPDAAVSTRLKVPVLLLAAPVTLLVARLSLTLTFPPLALSISVPELVGTTRSAPILPELLFKLTLLPLIPLVFVPTSILPVVDTVNVPEPPNTAAAELPEFKSTLALGVVATVMPTVV